MIERLGDLSSRERELVDAAASGNMLECSQLPIEELSVSDDPAHIIRAELLRELLLKRCDKPPDPRGVRLHRARVTGTLDLTHIEATVGMELWGCLFDQPVLLRDAHLPWLTLTGSCVPALDGDLLRVDGDLFLDGFRATGGGEDGAVRLLGAHITGQLFLRGAELTNEDGPVLIGDGLRVDRDLALDGGFRATGGGEGGAVRLLRAHITGQLSLSDAELTNEDGPALVADMLQVDRALSLDRGFRATGHGEGGAVRLLGAHITGQLVLRDAELTNKDGPALVGDGLQVDGDLFLGEGFRATGHGEGGAVRLLRAHITGQLLLRDVELTNKDGPALYGDLLRVDGALSVGEGFRATGHGEGGAVRLLGAHITGQLVLRDAELTNKDGLALVGDGLQVDGDLFLGEGFQATGHGEGGAVRLLRAHITGQLSLRDAELTNEDGPALLGDGLRVDRDLFLGEGFRATGHGEGGAVRLLGAHVTGQLFLSDAELTNENGLVLDLQDAEVNSIFLPPRLICSQGVAGRSTCDATARRVDLSGFVYASLEGCHWSQWLHLIARHTYGYRPQPYQQLAAVRRAVGHDADARTILIAQQQDFHERGDLGGWLTRTVHRVWGALGGYGYRTGRIALTLLIVLLAAAGLGIAAGHIPTGPGRYVAMHTAQADTPHGPCSLTEQIGVGIDRGLPLGTTGIRDRCDFDTTSRGGQAVTWATWGLQLLVWALATLFVAGYVNLIRKAA